MNKGTIIRTVLGLFAILSEAIIVSGLIEVNHIYEILSFIFMAVILCINTYFNNDYTEDACLGTGTTRLLKQQKKLKQNGGNLIGEDFEEEPSYEFEGI